MRQRDRVANASDFDLEREVDPRYRRLLFGAGAHACLGAGLAIAEARVVIGALLSLERELEIVRRRYNHGKTYPGYSSLQVRLRATAQRMIAA
jgi:cytochrome P450